MLRPFRLAREHHKARGVVGLVLDVLGQNIETVNIGGKPRGDRRRGFIAAFGDDPRATRGIRGDDRPDAELADDAAALAKRVNVALHRPDTGKRGAARPHQLMPDRQKPFADNEKAGRRQQMMDIGDASGDRIFDRDHAEVGLSGRNRGERIFEGRTGQRLGLGPGFDDGEMRVGAGLALEGYFSMAGHGAF